MSAKGKTADPLVEACGTVAWLIAANKPTYPLFLWAFVGSGVAASFVTAISLPLWLAIGWLIPSRSLPMRAAIPLVGLMDTLLATKLFGSEAATELFFAPVALLALVAFRDREAWVSRALTALLFVVFVALHGRYGAPWHVWSETELATLATINILAVASLMAFLGWSFAGAPRG